MLSGVPFYPQKQKTMGANETKVKMQAGAMVREMEIGCAERLLAWKGSCWTLADPNWAFDGTHLKRKAAKEEKKAIETATKKKTTAKKK